MIVAYGWALTVMSLKNLVFFCTLICMALAICTYAGNASEQDNKKLIIGTTIESSPYIISGQVNKGFDVDLFSIVFKRIGYDIEIIHSPINRLPTLLKNDKIDIMATYLNPSWSCAKSKPYRYWLNAILTTSDHADSIEGPGDLKGKIVGSFSGASSTLSLNLDEYIDTYRAYYEIPSSKHAARMLLSNRFDAYIGDAWAVSYFFDLEAKKQKRQSSLIAHYMFEPNPQILCFSDESLRNMFEEELAIFRASGEYDVLTDKYIPNMPK